MCACACLSEAPRGSGPCPLGPFLLPLTRGFGQIWRGHKITTYPFSPRKNGRKGMAQSQGWVRRYFKAFCKGFFVAVPVAVTFLDRVACVARVEGASMQPSLNPGGSQSSDVVLLNHWKVRNFEVQRGDIVSLVFSEDGVIWRMESYGVSEDGVTEIASENFRSMIVTTFRSLC
ncbi:mitochondrial inner membrane protease subunit 2 isoform X8 [Bubalus bubalis]|uniref:mitochondrial inner membrane protease subunit 2 isoform X8 n=1 Tax=Bubalus bubalis TaxID=89462 RepID=UPI001E1B80A9|nr:mitochondrial inner membrane protease subunit 2 isoform X8 [Bubalus bubalis]